MAKTSKASIGVTVTGDGVSNTYVPPGSPLTNTSAPHGGTVLRLLTAGANSIALPTGAVGVVIDPPTTSTNVKTLKGVPGDVGTQILPNAPMMLTFNAGVTTFELNSVANETISLHWL